MGELVSSLDRIRCCERDESDHRFEQIVGSSTALESVLSEVGQVAAIDSTVLVLGEAVKR